MPFTPKSNKQQNFLRALKGDQTKGLPPVAGPMAAPMAGGMKPPMAPPAANPILAPPMRNPMPIPVQHMPQPAAPKLMPPSAPMNPVAAPSLPGNAQLPKFGKMKNSLKKGPFNKSNKA